MFERNRWALAGIAVALSVAIAQTVEAKKKLKECEPSEVTVIEPGTSTEIYGMESYGGERYGREPFGRERFGSERFGTERFGTERFGAREGMRSEAFRYQPDLRQATALIGHKITDNQGRNIGTIDDLAIDADNGMVAFAILSRGGILGIGEKLVPVPFKAIEPTAKRDEFKLKIEEGTLERVPTLRDNEFSRLEQRRFTENIYREFNMQPYWITGYQSPEPGSGLRRERRWQDEERSITPQDQMTPQDRSWREERGTRGPGYPEERSWREDRSARDSTYPEERTWREERDTRSRDSGYPEGRTWREERDTRSRDSGYPEGRTWREERGTGAPGSRLGMLPRGSMRGEEMRSPGKIVRATDLLDESVVDASRREIGEVNDLMIDINSAGIGYAVILTDLQGPDRLIAVPWQVVDVMPTREGVQLAVNVSQNQLARAPAFSEDAWPNMSTSRWTARLHSYYGVQPTWSHFGYVGPTGMGAVRSQMFSSENLQKFTGTVDSIYRNTRFEGMSNMVRLQLSNVEGGRAATQPAEMEAAQPQTLQVFLAPAPFFEQQDVRLQPGDRVTIEGAMIQIGGKRTLVAKMLTKDNKTVEFRAEDGRPLWRHGRMGGQPSERFQQDQPQRRDGQQRFSEQEPQDE